MVSRQTWRVDVLLLLGLAILGCGLWFAFGNAAALMYAGIVLIVVGAILSAGQRGDKP